MKKKNQPAVAAKNYYPWIRISIVLLAVILYGSVIQFDFTLDDVIYFNNHTAVQKGLAGTGEIFSQGSMKAFDGTKGEQPYRPVTLLSFALQKETGTSEANVSHFINLLIYIFTGILLFSVLRRLWKKADPLISGMVVLLFMAHPVHTEVVCSVKSRDELLYVLFGLISVRYFIKANDEGKTIPSVILSVLFFFLSMLSKESAITLAGIYPLIILFFYKEKNLKQVLMGSLPFWFAAAAFLLLRTIVLNDGGPGNVTSIVNNVLYGAGSFSELWGTKMSILLLYLRLLLLPYPLSWDYSYNQVPLAGLLSPLSLISLLIHLFLAGWALVNFKKRDTLSFAILFYFISFSLTNNLFFRFGSTAAERFLFLPSVGFVIALVWTGLKLLKLDATSFSGRHKTTMILLFFGVLIIYSVLTLNRVPVWKNNQALFESGLESAPNSVRTNFSMGNQFVEQSKLVMTREEKERLLAEAANYYQKCVDIFPGYWDALYNLGTIADEKKDSAKGLEYYRLAVQYDPVHKDALNNIGVYYASRNRFDSALYFFQKVISLSDKHAMGQSNMGYVYWRKGEYAKAIPYVKKAIELEPRTPRFYNLLGLIYRSMGNEEEAKKNFALANSFQKK